MAGREEDYCNGVLITRRHILTVLHCTSHTRNTIPLDLLDADELIIKMNITNATDHYNTPALTVKSITAHPSYKLNSPVHELAIIELNNPLPITDTFMPICLPTTLPDTTSHCYITGYNHPLNVVNKHLHYTNITTFLNCTIHVLLPQQTICTNAIACYGDSGGPLACHDGYELIGLVNGGTKTCIQLTIFMNITSNLNWHNI